VAVLLEAISVVVRRSVIDERFPGGWNEFVLFVPNATLCADDYLARVGFMQPSEVEDFVVALETHNIVFVSDGAARDMVVIDQQHGPLVKCDWLEFGRIKLPSGDDHLVGACRLSGDQANMLSTPEGWTYEGSPTRAFGLDPEPPTSEPS